MLNSNCSLEESVILFVGYLNYINQTYCSFVHFFIDGRKVERGESMVFVTRGQAKEGGMQVLL